MLVCGDWADASQDWAALVLDLEGCFSPRQVVTKDGVALTGEDGCEEQLYVKPLDMTFVSSREDDMGVGGASGGLLGAGESAGSARGGRDNDDNTGRHQGKRRRGEESSGAGSAAQAGGVVDIAPGRVVHLSLSEDPVQAVPLAAVMDRLRFTAVPVQPSATAVAVTREESEPRPLTVGTIVDRGLSRDKHHQDRETLRRTYVFSPEPRSWNEHFAPSQEEMRRSKCLPSPRAVKVSDNPLYGDTPQRTWTDMPEDGVVVFVGTSGQHRRATRGPAPSPLRPMRLCMISESEKANAPSCTTHNPSASCREDVSMSALSTLHEGEVGEHGEGKAEGGALGATTTEEIRKECESSGTGVDAVNEEDDDVCITAGPVDVDGRGSGSSKVGAGAAAVLRNALNRASSGALTLSLPIADVKLVLAELEELQRQTDKTRVPR